MSDRPPLTARLDIRTRVSRRIFEYHRALEPSFGVSIRSEAAKADQQLFEDVRDVTAFAFRRDGRDALLAHDQVVSVLTNASFTVLSEEDLYRVDGCLDAGCSRDPWQQRLDDRFLKTLGNEGRAAFAELVEAGCQ